jgi:hypothetical protein
MMDFLHPILLYKSHTEHRYNALREHPNSGLQYVTLQNYFSHLSLVIYFFPTPLIKLKLLIGGTLLITNQVYQSPLTSPLTFRPN